MLNSAPYSSGVQLCHSQIWFFPFSDYLKQEVRMYLRIRPAFEPTMNNIPANIELHVYITWLWAMPWQRWDDLLSDDKKKKKIEKHLYETKYWH